MIITTNIRTMEKRTTVTCTCAYPTTLFVGVLCLLSILMCSVTATILVADSNSATRIDSVRNYVTIVTEIDQTGSNSIYASTDRIECVFASNDGQQLSFEYNNVKIVKSSQLNVISSSSSIVELMNYLENSWVTSYSATNVSVNVAFNFTKLLGPILTADSPSILNSTNATIIDWNEIAKDPFQILYVNDEGTQILGTSKPFTIVQTKVDVNINVDELFPGEFLDMSIVAPDGTYEYQEYFKIFKVPFSVHNDTSVLNDPTISTLISTQTLQWYQRTVLVNWNTPGMYQVVLFSKYHQIILGISEVFHVSSNTKTTKSSLTIEGTTTSNSSQPYIGICGTNITYRLTRTAATPFNRNIRFFFIPEKANPTEGYRSVLLLNTVWDSTSTTIRFTSTVPLFKAGRYKLAALLIDEYPSGAEYPLAVTRAVRINTGINVTLPKRWLIQGETIPYDIYNPYFNYSWKIQDTYRYGYVTHIVPSIFPNYKDSDYLYGSQAVLPNLVAQFPPGQYRFEVFLYEGEYYHPLLSITNSSFRVLANNASITIDKKQYPKGKQIEIEYSLTTQRKIPLIGPYQVKMESLTTQPYFDYGMKKADNEVASSTLNGTLLFSGCCGEILQGEDFQIKIYFSYNDVEYIWAISESFNIS
jgi:hypothetical protein